MLPRSRAIQAIKPALKPVQLLQTGSWVSRRAYVSTRPDAPGAYNSRVPIIAVGSVITFVPFYYLFHSTKPAASGYAEMTAARRQGNPTNEYRDPRDTPVKTLEQQKKGKGTN